MRRIGNPRNLSLIRTAKNTNNGTTYKLYDSNQKGPFRYRMHRESPDGRHDTFSKAESGDFHKTMDQVEAKGKQAKFQGKSHGHQVVDQGGLRYHRTPDIQQHPSRTSKDETIDLSQTGKDRVVHDDKERG